jgi:hypothetical protein
MHIPAQKNSRGEAMRIQAMTRRFAIAAIGLLSCAVSHAQLPVQQLTVAFTNSVPNASVDTLTMPNNLAAIVAANPLLTNGTNQRPDFANLYTALVWVTNPATSTLDVIYADAEQRTIWRLPGPSYTNPIAIFTWSRNVPGPACPVGLAADSTANVYVVSAGCLWGRASVWVLPITAAGGYGSPLLIDNTFTDPASKKPVPTLALAEVLVAGSAASTGATPAWGAGDLLVLVADLLSTRVIDYSQAQIQSVLATPALQPKGLAGPASTVVTQAQFSTQAITAYKIKFPAVPLGMDMEQNPNTNTPDMTLLFSTVDGRILDFDSATNAFITPYAVNLGLGLTKLKVGTFQANPYVFVGQLPGKILEFAAPASGSSNTLATKVASVSTGVHNPTDLAVTNSGSAPAGACVGGASFTGSITGTALTVSTFASGPPIAVGQIIAGNGITPGTTITSLGSGAGGTGTYNLSAAQNVGSPDSPVAMTSAGCAITPQFALNIHGQGGIGNIPPGATITADSCSFIDDRPPSGQPGQCRVGTLDLGVKCANMPHVMLPPNICGAWGVTGASISATKITASKVDQNINNTLSTFVLNPNSVLPAAPDAANPNCLAAGTAPGNGPIAVWGPVPGVESPIPEDQPDGEGPLVPTVMDVTIACSPDPPPTGGGSHVSVLLQGTVNAPLTAPYIDGEFNNLQAAFNNITNGSAPGSPPPSPIGNQIVDTNPATIQPTIQGFITQSLNYFNQQNQQGFNCALNTLYQGVQYVNSLATNSPTDFIGAPQVQVPYDQNPSGDLIYRMDHLYYDVYIFAGIATTGKNPTPLTADALNLPASAVPVCPSLNAPSGLAFNPTTGNLYVANYNTGQVLVYAPVGPNGQMVLQPNLTLSTSPFGPMVNPVRLAFAPISESSDIGGYLFVTDTGNNTVAVFNNGSSIFSIGSVTRPLGVAADIYGFVYVAENFGGTPPNFTDAVEDIRVFFAGEGWDNCATYTKDSNGVLFSTIGALAYNGNDLLVGLPNQVNYYPTFNLTHNSQNYCSNNAIPPPAPDGNQVTDSGLDGVIGITIDPNGNVDVTNYYGDPTFAQFASATGQQTTLNLTGTPSPAIQNPQGVAVDAAGNIYVSNTANNVIYVYNSMGVYQYTIH